MIYVITCKNDFPPATEYNIISKEQNIDLTLCHKNGDFDRIIQRPSNDTLFFKCVADDPVEAMIKFWEKYMYGG